MSDHRIGQLVQRLAVIQRLRMRRKRRIGRRPGSGQGQPQLLAEQAAAAVDHRAIVEEQVQVEVRVHLTRPLLVRNQDDDGWRRLAPVPRTAQQGTNFHLTPLRLHEVFGQNDQQAAAGHGGRVQVVIVAVLKTQPVDGVGGGGLQAAQKPVLHQRVVFGAVDDQNVEGATVIRRIIVAPSAPVVANGAEGAPAAAQRHHQAADQQRRRTRSGHQGEPVDVLQQITRDGAARNVGRLDDSRVARQQMASVGAGDGRIDDLVAIGRHPSHQFGRERTLTRPRIVSQRQV